MSKGKLNRRANRMPRHERFGVAGIVLAGIALGGLLLLGILELAGIIKL